jgi:hypothetical protein
MEYSFKGLVSLRSGYIIESLDDEETTALSGPSAGFSVDLPFGDATEFGVDYSLRHSDAFGLIHSIGVRLDL